MTMTMHIIKAVLIATVFVASINDAESIRGKRQLKGGKKCNPQYIKKIFTCLDKNKDGAIELDEALAQKKCFKNYSKDPEKLKSFLGCLDDDKDEKITAREALENGCKCFRELF